MKNLSGEIPRLVGVHPASEVWPANILRIHLFFDQEMDPSGAAQHVSIETSAGEVVADALVDLPDGLWSPDGKILTVLLHPGRLKNGLAARERLGLPLVPGVSYQLRVSGRIASIRGLEMGADPLIAFNAGEPAQQVIDSAVWSGVRPQAGGLAPLLVNTGRLLDALAVIHSMRIETVSGCRVAAEFSAEGERVIARPIAPWPDEEILVVVTESLEDACGNRIVAPFENRISDEIFDER